MHACMHPDTQTHTHTRAHTHTHCPTMPSQQNILRKDKKATSFDEMNEAAIYLPELQHQRLHLPSLLSVARVLELPQETPSL